MKLKIIALSLVIMAITLSFCDRGHEKRKIKLADGGTNSQSSERFTSTIHLEPALRRAIAIMFFENKTGDQNLEWLEKGLTEMFIRSLSQSSSLSLLSTDRIFEILRQVGPSASGQFIDVELAAIVAREANVEAILTGTISRKGDSLQIKVRVHEPNQGKILKEEAVEGKNLEAIFTMVDDLTQKIKNTLAVSLEERELAQSIADLSTNSLEAWRHYAAGIDFQQKAMVNEAVAQFKQAVAADPEFVAAYYPLCLWLLGQGEWDKAREYFDKLKSLRNKATPKEKYQIDRLEGSLNRDLRQIIDASHNWLEQNPNDVEAYFNLGDIYFALQNYDQALRHYQAILAINPNYKLAHNQIGYCYARMGRLDSAVVTMKRYQSIAPDEPNPFDSMGEIYLIYGQYRQAEHCLKRSLKLNEQFANSWILLSNVYLEQGQHDRALKTIAQFLNQAATPVTRADGYAQMGMIQWRMGNMDAAIDYFQKFVTNRLASYRAATWVYELNLEKGDTLAAKKSLQLNYGFIRDSLVARAPVFIRDLANFSLWYDVNVDETIEIIQRTLAQTARPGVQMWGQFYLAMLYLKMNQIEAYQKIAPNFTAEFTQLMKDIREVPFANETWKSFKFFNQYAYNAMDEGVAKYSQLIEYCSTHELMIPEMIFRLFLADLYLHQNERMKAEAQLKWVGAPEESKWLVIAPFDNTNGFQKKYPPEREIKLNEIYQHQALELRWQAAGDGFNEGYINFKQIYPKYNWKVGYGLIYAKSPDRRRVHIRMGTNDSVKLWVNDQEVWRMNFGRDAVFDNDVVTVILQPGLNKILLKVCNRINEWGFYFRMTDEEGVGFPDIEFVSADQVDSKVN